MILVLEYSAINKQLAQKLADKENTTFVYHPLPIDFEKDGRKEKLTIMDFTAKGPYLVISGETVADYLMAQGLPDSVKIIDVLIPDIQNKLPRFAEDLTNHFKNRYNRDITVRCYFEIRHDYTFLIPPEPGYNNWKIYAVHEKDRANKSVPLDIHNLHQITKKDLLWEGTDVDEYLATSTQHYIARKTELALLEAKSTFFKAPAVPVLEKKETNKRKIKNGLHLETDHAAKKHHPIQIDNLKPH